MFCPAFYRHKRAVTAIECLSRSSMLDCMGLCCKKIVYYLFFICILKVISYNKNRVRIKMTHVGGISPPLGYLAPDFFYKVFHSTIFPELPFFPHCNNQYFLNTLRNI